MKHLLLIGSLSLNVFLLAVLLSLTHGRGYLGRGLMMLTDSSLNLPTDTLPTQAAWQNTVKDQLTAVTQHHFTTCLFGDSISAPIDLGDRTFNFALSGMSTISQIVQLETLKTAQATCDLAIVAIGTNDAAYRTTADQFEQNLIQIIAMLKQYLGTQKIVLLPAFYSTVAASHDPTLAGPLERVQAVNARISRVAQAENLYISTETVQPLFAGEALRDDLTDDGVHLNDKGQQIYQTALLQLINMQQTGLEQ